MKIQSVVNCPHRGNRAITQIVIPRSNLDNLSWHTRQCFQYFALDFLNSVEFRISTNDSTIQYRNSILFRSTCNDGSIDHTVFGLLLEIELLLFDLFEFGLWCFFIHKKVPFRKKRSFSHPWNIFEWKMPVDAKIIYQTILNRRKF